MSTKVVKRRKKLDRLSNLPDPVIYHILSLMNTKHAVQTCVLSKKWKHHWTHIHSLNFDFSSFSRRAAFGKFVLRILRHRKPFNLQRLSFHYGYGYSSSKPPPYIKKIFEYAISRGVKELETELYELPPCVYGCQSLGTLKYQNYYQSYYRRNYSKRYPTCTNRICSFGFGALSTLELDKLSLSSENNNRDLFSTYLNLKNLIIESCSISSSSASLENLTIVSSSVVYLKITHLISYSKDVKIVILSAPRLETFDMKGTSDIELRIYKCPVLRKVNLRINTPVAWKETIDWKQEYFWDLKFMAGGYNYNTKPVTLLSFNFSNGKFMSYLIAGRTETTVSEMDEVEGKRLWLFDGEMVWQSSPKLINQAAINEPY